MKDIITLYAFLPFLFSSLTCSAPCVLTAVVVARSSLAPGKAVSLSNYSLYINIITLFSFHSNCQRNVRDALFIEKRCTLALLLQVSITDKHIKNKENGANFTVCRYILLYIDFIAYTKCCHFKYAESLLLSFLRKIMNDPRRFCVLKTVMLYLLQYGTQSAFAIMKRPPDFKLETALRFGSSEG